MTCPFISCTLHSEYHFLCSVSSRALPCPALPCIRTGVPYAQVLCPDLLSGRALPCPQTVPCPTLRLPLPAS